VKPSDVYLAGSFPPFVNTFDRAECETAAAFMVRALAVKGDSFRPIDWPEIRKVLEADVNAAEQQPAKPYTVERLVLDLLSNPFVRPDFHELAKRGFARWLGEPGASLLEFTPAGLERLRKWLPPARAASDA